MEEQSQQQAFTFASPISLSKTHEDTLDFDYQSSIEQSKISTSFFRQGDKLWMDDHAEAMNKNHNEILLRDLPEEAYEISLRDLSELSLTRSATEEAVIRSVRPNSNKKPRQKKTPSIDRVGCIIKPFMPSLSRAAATAPVRKKSFSNSTVTASGNGGSVQNAVSEARYGPVRSWC